MSDIVPAAAPRRAFVDDQAAYLAYCFAGARGALRVLRGPVVIHYAKATPDEQLQRAARQCQQPAIGREGGPGSRA